MFNRANPRHATKDENRTHPETGEPILTELPQTVMITPCVPWLTRGYSYSLHLLEGMTRATYTLTLALAKALAA